MFAVVPNFLPRLIVYNIMIASELIAHDIPALQIEQSGRDAFHLLSDHHVKHLPVTRDGKLVGIISEEDIFNHKLYDPVSEYDLSVLRPLSVHPEDHLFEIMRIMGENLLTTIPVTDREGNYLGMISQNMMLRALSGTTSFAMPGGIIVLELNRRDYSLTALSRIAEEENTRVLAAFVSSYPDSEMLEVTVKVNRDDTSRIVAAYERFGFTVKQTFSEDSYGESMKDRYDSLMNYLNI